MERIGEGAVEGDRFTLSEAARVLGIGRGPLHRWLKRHRLMRRCPKEGKYRYVNASVLEHYEAATERPGVKRSSVRPSGWVGIYRAAELARCHTTAVYRAVAREEVRAVRVGYINYYCPGDLERLRLAYNDRPLPGWVSVASAAREHGANRRTVLEWLRRHGHELRMYRRLEDRQLAWHALATSIEAWRRSATSSSAIDDPVLKEHPAGSRQHREHRSPPAMPGPSGARCRAARQGARGAATGA